MNDDLLPSITAFPIENIKGEVTPEWLCEWQEAKQEFNRAKLRYLSVLKKLMPEQLRRCGLTEKQIDELQGVQHG